MSRAIVVVPCFNEARRLRLEEFCRFVLQQEGVDLLFVDDGSTDATAEMLAEFCQDMGDRCRLLKLPRNQGKAEAVRLGLLTGCHRGADFVGFWDADLATPLDEIPNFCALLERASRVEWVFGSRVRLLGRAIDRRPLRHYLGRAWATTVSLLLRLPIYDTQCGAKMFRVSQEFTQMLQEPFCSRWVFDVELIARLLQTRRGADRTAAASIYEVPLSSWRDVAGSKVRVRDFGKASIELAKIYWHYLRRGAMSKRLRPVTPMPAPPGSAPVRDPVDRRVTVGAGAE
jgi:glycosyltransferase involved in cell wall biosynthesis